MTNEIIYYFGMALFLLGAIGYGTLMSFSIKNKLRITQEVLLKKKTLLFAGFFGIIIVSLILFTVSFYLDPATLNLLKEKELVVDGLHQFLSYFFLILMGIFAFTFLTSFFYYFYFTSLDEKIRKILKIVMYSSIPLIIVSFILMSEGNAPYLDYPLCNSIYIGKHGIKFVNHYVAPAPYFTSRGTPDGGIIVAFYAIFILSGAFLVLAICDHFVYKYYGHHDILTTCFFIAFPAGLVGARLWYVLLDISANGSNSQFITDPLEIFNVAKGGLGIMGGAILGIIAGVSAMLVIKYWLKDPKYRHMNYLRLVDIIVPCILVAQAIGRFGNFFNAEVHGTEIPMESLYWLPSFIRINYQYDYSSMAVEPGKAFLPLASIETITNLVGYFFIYFGIVRGLGKYHSEGTGAGWYLVWYGATRAILEPLRDTGFYYGMSVISSYVMIGAGLFIVLFFTIWKILREKKLWIYKNKEIVDSIILKDNRSEIQLKRDSIIVAVVAIVIIVTVTVLATIW